MNTEHTKKINLAANLKYLMQSRKINVADLAQALSVQQESIIKLMSGELDNPILKIVIEFLILNILKFLDSNLIKKIMLNHLLNI